MRGGDSRAVEQTERGVEFNSAAVRIFPKWRDSQGVFLAGERGVSQRAGAHTAAFRAVFM